MTKWTTLPLALVIAGFSSAAAQATDGTPPPPLDLVQSADESNLSEFVWKKRPIVVFADSPDDPAYIEQMDLLQARLAALDVRDVIILTDTDPDAMSPIRTKLRPRGFMLVLVGKDGGVKLRKPAPWTVREISRVIDKMPMRKREIREGVGG